MLSRAQIQIFSNNNVNASQATQSDASLATLRRQHGRNYRRANSTFNISAILYLGSFLWLALSLLVHFCAILFSCFLAYGQLHSKFMPSASYPLATYGAIIGFVMTPLAITGIYRQKFHTQERRLNITLLVYLVIAVFLVIELLVTAIITHNLALMASETRINVFMKENLISFEKKIYSRISVIVESDPNLWKMFETQHGCCGYNTANRISRWRISGNEMLGQASSGKDQGCSSALLCGENEVPSINKVHSRYCTKSQSFCSEPEKSLCPIKGASWCRDSVLGELQNDQELLCKLAIVILMLQLMSICLSSLIWIFGKPITLENHQTIETISTAINLQPIPQLTILNSGDNHSDNVLQ